MPICSACKNNGSDTADYRNPYPARYQTDIYRISSKVAQKIASFIELFSLYTGGSSPKTIFQSLSSTRETPNSLPIHFKYLLFTFLQDICALSLKTISR